MLGFLGSWLAYDQLYLRGGDRPLAWRDVSAALRDPRFVRHVSRSFEDDAELRGFVEGGRHGRLAPVSGDSFVLVAPGPRSSTGYSVRVEEVREERGRVVVQVRERAPRIGEGVAARVTYPFVLLALPDRDKPVAIDWLGR